MNRCTICHIDSTSFVDLHLGLGVEIVVILLFVSSAFSQLTNPVKLKRKKKASVF